MMSAGQDADKRADTARTKDGNGTDNREDRRALTYDGSDLKTLVVRHAAPSSLTSPKSLHIATHRDIHDPVLRLLDDLHDADNRTEAVLRSFHLPEHAYIEARQEAQGRTRLAVSVLKRIRDKPAAKESRRMTRAEADAIKRSIAELLEPYINDEPAQGSYRVYDPPKNPELTVRRQIRNGVITDRIALDAELRALAINGETAIVLRALLPEEETA